jgi:hypothetical protein
VEVTERGGHVDRKIIPLEAVLLCRASHAVVLAAVFSDMSISSLLALLSMTLKYTDFNSIAVVELVSAFKTLF